MSIETILLVILLCLGAFQGIIYGFMFWWSKNETGRTANRLFATMLFFLSYRLLVQVLRLFGLGYYDTWYHFMIDFNWVYGPLIYFFVKARVVPGFRLQYRDGIHFIPVIVQVICSNFVRIQNFYWDGTRDSLSWLGYWGYVVWMNYPTIYIIASLLIIYYAFRAEQLLNKVADQGVVIPEQTLWMRRVVLSFKLYFSIVVAVLLVDLFLFDITFSSFYYYFERFYYYPLFAGVAVLTYWLGLAGFSKKDANVLTVLATISAEERKQLQRIGDQLENIMKEERVYKDPDLTLSALAEKLAIKPYLLSRCLKLQFEKKFTDLVNEHRVVEWIQLVRDPGNERYTLLTLAYEAGFNSKASFNRAVKKHTGLSPRQLKTRIRAGVKSDPNWEWS